MIILESQGYEASYELNNIIHLFEPYLEKNYVLTFIYEEAVPVGKVTMSLQDSNKRVISKKQDEITLLFEPLQDKKQVKAMIKRLAYKLLSNEATREMPWGTLTGIRPTKIVGEYLKEGLTDAQIEALMKSTYLISDEKLRLVLQVAKEEQSILTKNKQEEISLYIGIPFCPTRCVYCSFTSYSLEKYADQVDAYLEALCKEIDFVANEKGHLPIRSLYIGGGTPTSLNEVQLEKLLSHIEKNFDIKKIEEYTVEAGRPDTITKGKLQLMKDKGVGRISINPQSMRQKTLEAIGRSHSADQIKEVFSLARQMGHQNINMDIILGLPGETLEDVVYTLDELSKLSPESVTVHTMAIKRAADLKKKQEDADLAKADQISQMLELCENKLQEMGLNPYYMYRQKDMIGNFENVGYAKSGYACIYNVEIMAEAESIIALGAGGVTKMVYQNGERIDRIPNVKSFKDYIERMDEMLQRKKDGFKKYVDTIEVT
jgi:oxygen-independent coproporphyrinogen-3 oxidase